VGGYDETEGAYKPAAPSAPNPVAPLKNCYVVMASGYGRGRGPVAVIAEVEPATDHVKILQAWNSRGEDPSKDRLSELEDLVRSEERRRRDERRTGRTRDSSDL
jgi:hypothetical protein